jgi:hypothetical protein
MLDTMSLKGIKSHFFSLLFVPRLYRNPAHRINVKERQLAASVFEEATIRLSWASFLFSFGADYAETPQGKSRFRANAMEALYSVKAVYPQLKIEI